MGLPSTACAQRRRSSAGLASSSHRRRSSARLQGVLQDSGEQCFQREGPFPRTRHQARRRSSTTTFCVHPRFSVRRRRAARLRTIDPHLLGPSMLLASLVQMSPDKETEEQTEDDWGSGEEGSETSLSSCSESERGNGCDSGGVASGNEREEPEEERQRSMWLKWEELSVPMSSIQPRPLIRAPRCLRRNSSHLLPAEAVYRSRATCGVYGRYRRASQVYRPSSGYKTSPRPSAGPQGRRQPSLSSPSLSSPNLYHCSPYWREAGRRDSLGLLPRTYYDPRLDTWTTFISYVDTGWTGRFVVCVCMCVAVCLCPETHRKLAIN